MFAWLPSRPTAVSVHSPLTVSRPRTVSPKSVKNAIVASRSRTAMPTFSSLMGMRCTLPSQDDAIRSTARGALSQRRLTSPLSPSGWPAGGEVTRTCVATVGARLGHFDQAYGEYVGRPCFDDVERAALCDLLERLGPDAPTVLVPWTTRDIAVHLYLREHDAVAGPGLVLPGPWARVAARHHARARGQDFWQIVAAVRSGPRGVFRLGWLQTSPQPQRDVRSPRRRAPRQWRRAPGVRPGDGPSLVGQRQERSVGPVPSIASVRARPAQCLDRGVIPCSPRKGPGPGHG